MIVCVPVRPDHEVAAGFGRSRRVAVASVSEGRITAWDEHDVAWDVLHDEGTEGAHHTRVLRFLREHGVEAVAVEQLGPGMARMITAMGLRLSQGARGDARAAVLAVASANSSTP